MSKTKKISIILFRPIPKNTDLKNYNFRFYRNNREKKIMLRFTEYEYQKLTKDLQMPLAKYCRETALKNVIVRRINPPRVDKELIRALAFWGNNLNQLTKLSHHQNNANNLDLLMIASELALIRQSLDDLKNQYTAKGVNDDS